MANDKNLKSQNKRTKSEQREIASKGGKASGEARRRKKQLKEQMNLLLSLPIQSKRLKTKMSKIGIESEEQDNQMALVMAMFAEASKGNVQAFNSIRDLIGEKPADNVRHEFNSDVEIKIGGEGYGD